MEQSPELTVALKEQALVTLVKRSLVGSTVYPVVWVLIGVTNGLLKTHQSFLILNAAIFFLVTVIRISCAFLPEHIIHRHYKIIVRLIEAAVIAHGFHYGLLTTYIYSADDLAGIVFLMMLSGAGIVASGSVTLAINRNIGILFPTLMLAPLCIYLISHLNTTNGVTLCVVIIFVIYNMIATRRVYNDYWTAITSRALLAQRAAELERKIEEVNVLYLDETIPIPSRREFSKLSSTFDKILVTLRKQIDNLRKRELQLTESQVVANLGSWDLNLVSQKLEWSNQTYRLFDKDTEEFIPSFDEYSRLVHPDDLETMQASFNNALVSDDIPYHVESRIINASGRKWFMEAFGKVRRDTNGNPISIFGTAQDVTERKLAEASLKESEEKFRSIAENSPDLILILDYKATIRFINRTITGKSVEEVTGTNVYDSFSKKDNVKIEKALSQVSQTGKTGTFEISLTIPDFADRIFECRIRPITFQGDKQNLLVNASDITERKRTEIALLNAHDELEQRVRKRTAELEQKRHSLEESNTALKILLRESGTLKEEVEENIQLNLRESVLPYLDEVAVLLPNKDLELYIDTVKSNIETITSSFSRSLSLEFKNLTPREIQVANFIRQGKTNKDIANILNVTVSAVDFHRRNIREKLSLKGKKANLRTHLLKYVG